ncbi:MAG: GNAT family N-acetyltransferase [Planctomycetota bacterium]|jgi:mycothiol synthase
MIQLRPYSGAADLDRVVEVLAAADALEGFGRALSGPELEAEWVGRDPTRDVVLAVGPDGAAAGFIALAHYPGRGEDAFLVEGAVHPEHRRRGVGTRLLGHAREEAARRAAALETSHPAYFQAYTREVETGRIALFTKLGLEPFLEVRNLARPLAGLPAPKPAPGVSIRGFEPGADDAATRRALAEAFEDDPQEAPVSDDRWRELLEHANPELWVLAVEDEECAGICRSRIEEARNRRLGIREGWVNEVGVRPRWRGRGLGMALLLAALHRLEEAGMDTAHLFVVAGNPTRAERLYERAGFLLRWRTLHHRVRIDT